MYQLPTARRSIVGGIIIFILPACGGRPGTAPPVISPAAGSSTSDSTPVAGTSGPVGGAITVWTIAQGDEEVPIE